VPPESVRDRALDYAEQKVLEFLLHRDSIDEGELRALLSVLTYHEMKYAEADIMEILCRILDKNF
jgi:hypothetical protein